MTPEKTLQKIDADLVTQTDKIAAARDRIKELHDERKDAALEVTLLDRDKERAVQVKRGQAWKKEHPKEHAAFLERICQENQEGVIEGFLEGWWDLDDNGNMAAPALVFKLDDFADAKTPMLAHVMAKAGIFKSIGQARKNGWDKPLVEGEWTVTKKKIRIRVEK